MKVSDTGKLAKLLDEKGIGYKILGTDTADVYAQLVFSDMAKDCEKAGFSILTMEEHDESLESFYLSLLGGNENA